MGLIVNIYRSDYDSTANLFHGKKRLTLVNIDGPFDPTDDAPAAILDRGPLGDPVIYPDYDLRPPNRTHAGPMSGGTFASTSDSRFHDALRAMFGKNAGTVAVRIHDRFDTWNDHYALTR